MIVMKFGGTSLGDADRINSATNIIKSKTDQKPVVVVSAVAKITDLLIKLINECAMGGGSNILKGIQQRHLEILKQLNIDQSLLDNDFEELSKAARRVNNESRINDKLLDYFQSFGERMSSKIVAALLNKKDINAQALNSYDIGFLTNSNFGEAEPLQSVYTNIKNNLKRTKVVPVITGFIGKTENGEITTLGRGGSDYTAAIIGASIDADEIQIWTDVDGIKSSDPKIVKNARTLGKVSFAEASELAYFGAKVLHPKTILPAMNKNIFVKVLNSFNPKNSGTTILKDSYRNKQVIKAIVCKKNITLINIESTRMLGTYGFLATIFDIFNKNGKSVDVVSTSEVSVSLTIDNDENIEDILSELKEIANVQLLKNRAIVCVVGEGMKNTPGIASRTFGSLAKGKINIEMISLGASKINITFIVDGKEVEKAVNILHDEFYG
jgi:aspartate kinase|tara:strand:- start:1114 stop:2433 length:1320 start_codon:yes stop_codon:yes gene_type:complete